MQTGCGFRMSLLTSYFSQGDLAQGRAARLQNTCGTVYRLALQCIQLQVALGTSGATCPMGLCAARFAFLRRVLEENLSVPSGKSC